VGVHKRPQPTKKDPRLEGTGRSGRKQRGVGDANTKGESGGPNCSHSRRFGFKMGKAGGKGRGLKAGE